MKFSAHIAVVGLLASVSCDAQTEQTKAIARSSPARLEQMPESLEVRYALSALPPHLRDGATTYAAESPPCIGRRVWRCGSSMRQHRLRGISLIIACHVVFGIVELSQSPVKVPAGAFRPYRRPVGN